MSVDRYEFDAPILPLLRRLQAAATADKAAEARASKQGKRAGCLGLLGFLSIFGVVFSMAELDLPWWLGLLPPSLLVAAIYFGVRAYRASRFDLDDRKLEAVTKVLRALRADADDDQNVNLTIDFRPYVKGGELQEESGGRMSAVREKTYSHRWVELSSGLVDGTRYQLAVTDVIDRKEKRKRKYTKVKERIRSTISLQMRLKAAKYGPADAVAAVLQATPPPAPLSLKRVVAKGQNLSLALTTPAARRVSGRSRQEPDPELLVSGDSLLKTFLWAYDGLGRSFGGAS